MSLSISTRVTSLFSQRDFSLLNEALDSSSFGIWVGKYVGVDSTCQWRFPLCSFWTGSSVELVYLKAICLVYNAIFDWDSKRLRMQKTLMEIQQTRTSLKFISAQNKRLWLGYWLTYFFVVNLKMLDFGLLLAQDMGLACCFLEWGNGWQAFQVMDRTAFLHLEGFLWYSLRSTVIFPMASTMLRKHPRLGAFIQKQHLWAVCDCFQSSSYA